MAIFKEYLFLVPLVVFLIAQTLKFLIHLVNGELDFGVYLKSGGMPSAHSAVVTSLTVAVGMLLGVKSFLFSVVVVFAAVVLYDAMNVRRESGNHARTLNQLLAKTLHSKLREFGQLKENVGHQPHEVAVGVFLGGFITWALLQGLV